MFIAALFTIAKTCKQIRCPSTDERIKKIWYIYTMEYYSVIKGTRVLSNEVDEPRDITQSDVSQKEQDKYRILMHIYGI